MHTMNAKHGSTAATFILFASIAAATLAGGCNSPGSAEARANEADERLRYGKYDEAVAQVEPIVQKNPGDWRAQYAYGRALMGQGKLEDARRALDRAYRLQPANEDVCISLSECMAKQKDVKDAYQLLRAFGRDFRSWRAYLALSRVAEDSGDPDTAATAAVDAIKVNEPLPGQRPSIEPYVRAADLAEHRRRRRQDHQGDRRSGRVDEEGQGRRPRQGALDHRGQDPRPRRELRRAPQGLRARHLRHNRIHRQT